MRLSPLQVKIIKKEVATLFGASANVILFGSKADPKLKGGDIDLLIKVAHKDDNLWRKALSLNSQLQQKLGEQKIDIITKYDGQKEQDIHKESLRTGVVL